MDPDLFKEDTSQYICAICCCVAVDPYYFLSDNGVCHFACHACSDKCLASSDVCPLCRSRLRGEKQSKATVFKNLIDGLTIRCKNKECTFATLVGAEKAWTEHEQSCVYKIICCPNGCGETFIRLLTNTHNETCTHAWVSCECGHPYHKIDKEQHMETCPLTMILCPHGCGLVYPRGKHHETTCGLMPCFCPFCRHTYPRKEGHELKCDMAPTPCKQCKMNVPKKFMEEHLKEECSHRLVKCAHCGAEVVYALRDDHDDDVCPELVISCPRDCGEYVKRKDLNNHYELCVRRPLNCKFCGIETLYCNLENHLTNCSQRQITCSCGKTLIYFLMPDHAKECPKTLVACPFLLMGCHAIIERENVQEHVKDPSHQILISQGEEFHHLTIHIDRSRVKWIIRSDEHCYDTIYSCGFPIMINYNINPNRLEMRAFMKEKDIICKWSIENTMMQGEARITTAHTTTLFTDTDVNSLKILRFNFEFTQVNAENTWINKQPNFYPGLNESQYYPKFPF